MEQKPLYLQGRGRGRGRRGVTNDDAERSRTKGRGRALSGQVNCAGNQSVDTTWAKNWTVRTGEKEAAAPKRQSSVEERFNKVQSKHQESVQRHLEDQVDDYESSEEEEELNDDEIFGSMLKSFSSTGGSGVDELGSLGRTQEYLMNSVKSKANVCLICIETIKRNESIWTCHGCYSMFHIPCIQKWVKDGVYQQVAQSDDNIDQRTIPWHCPKCRHEYKQSECPTRYFCFCGKEEDPKFDPWLVPHSCGQTCERQLKPECGHKCVLLCHPGPCPPCPQTVKVTCYCGNQPPQPRRCGTKEWSCGKPCKRLLACGHHRCSTPCHPGDCPACPEKSEQRCQCGRSSAVRPCASSIWQCDEVCGKPLVCGNHTCEKTCHSGVCGQCPRAGNRSCPCGKSSFELPCTEDVPTCLDTCGKLLECGVHTCAEMCHLGPCSTCRQMVVKTCRCGQRKKEIQCYKDYQCETKCSEYRDCGRHQCKRKCCDGNCPSCEQPCGKTLGCKNHKCASRCHRGRCYPCPRTVTLSCACGKTSITVPCGREKITKPPRCKKPCRTPPDCHHPERIPHRCHFGPCPPCRLVCDHKLPQCEHKCPAVCHSALRVKVKEQVHRAGPWEPRPETKMEVIAQPCPACEVPVPVTCLGKHETSPMPCSSARVGSCRRPCGRQLACGNHVCELDCHLVEGAKDSKSAGKTCQVCEEACAKPRPEGCVHTCLLPCHPGPCPECAQRIRMRCHCKMLVQHIECYEWISAGTKEQDRLKACPSRCPKSLPCGHQCTVTCHPGSCPHPERCTEKVKLRCKCRRRKKDFICNEVQAGLAKVECDETCDQLKEKQRKQKEEEEMAKEKEQREREQAELDEYERKMKGRKQRKRKQREEAIELSFMQRYGKFIVIPTVIVLLGLFTFYLFKT